MNKITIKDLVDIISRMDVEVEATELKPDVSLSLQGFDSLDMMSLFFDLEKKYSIEFGNDFNFDRWLSLNDIVENFNAKFFK